MATIGFKRKAIDIMINPKESAVNATAKNDKNNANKGMKQISTCFHREMDENFGMKFSLRRDCL
jgi:hypothetical protein